MSFGRYIKPILFILVAISAFILLFFYGLAGLASFFLFVIAVLIFISYEKDISIPIIAPFISRNYFRIKFRITELENSKISSGAGKTILSGLFFYKYCLRFFYYLAILFQSSQDSFGEIREEFQRNKGVIIDGSGSSLSVEAIGEKLEKGERVSPEILENFYKKLFNLYKRQQKKVAYFSLVGLLLMVITTVITGTITSFLFPNIYKTNAATFYFTQGDWSGGASSTSATHASNQSGWSYYSTSSPGITATSSIALTQSSFSFTDDGTVTNSNSLASGGGFSNGSSATTTLIGSGSGAKIKLNDDYVYPFGITVDESVILESCGGTPSCYQSLGEWQDAKKGDLINLNKIVVAKIDGPWTSATTTQLVIDGWTTDATRFIRIYTTPAARHTGAWSANRFRFEIANSASVNSAINIREENVRIDGLQIYANNDYSAPGGIMLSNMTGVTDIRISNSIIRGFGAYTAADSGGGISVSGSGLGANSVIRVWNNIVYDFGGSTYHSGIRFDDNDVDYSVYLYNNTSYNNTTAYKLKNYGSTGSGPSVIAKNNITASSTYGFDAENPLSFASSSNYNLSDLGGNDAPGANSKNLTSVGFSSTSTNDFRLASGDTGAKDSGVNISSDSNLAFNADIEGHLRLGSYDIGADEYETDEASVYTGAYGVGTFESATFDLGVKSSFSNITWNPSGQPSGALMDVMVAANNDNSSWNYINANDMPVLQGTTTAAVGLIRENCTGYSNCYTSLTAWLTAKGGISFTGCTSGDLVCANKVAIAKIDGSWTNPESINQILWIDGWNTGPNNYILVYTTSEARHGGKWDATKYRMDVSATADYARGLSIRENFVKIDGLQIHVTNNDYTGVNGIYVDDYLMATSSRVYLSNNIVKGTITSTGDTDAAHGIYIADADGTYFINNNIIYDFDRGAWSNSSILVYGNRSYVYNNTFFNSKISIYSNNISGTVAKNNLYQSNGISGANGYHGTFSTSSAYNLSNLSGDAPGSNPKNSTSVSFISTSTADFHLTSSDTGAKDAGANLSSDFYLAHSLDTDNQIRSGSWDIGADEYSVSSAYLLSSNRYFRYKAYFSTNNANITPVANDISVNYIQYATSSDMTSSKYDTSDAANLITKISWTETGTSSSETVKFQIRSSPDGSTWSEWCGYSEVSTSTCAGTNYFESANNGTSTSSSHPLRNGNNDRWFQYKIFLASSGAATANVDNIIVTYVSNAAPSFDSSFGTNGVNILQVATSSDPNWSRIKIDYAIKDIDTTAGNVTQNYITPTFRYSLDGGTSWGNVSTSTVSFGSAPSGGDVSDTNSDGTTDNKVLEGSYLTYTAYWNASSQISTSSSNFKIEVDLNDNEAANNTASAISATSSIDSAAPAFGAAPLAVTASTTPARLVLSATDSSAIEMRVSLNSDMSGSSWVSYSSSATASLATDPDTVYAQFRDYYGNTTATTSAITPETPTAVMIQDTSNFKLAPNEFRLFIAWKVVDVPPSAAFAKYNVYRSVDNSVFAKVAEVTSRTTNYYGDTVVSSSTIYYYKVTSEDANGNNSYLSSSVNGKADGAQNAGEGGGGTNSIAPAISNVATSSIYTTQATITWDTDTISDSRIDYMTNTGGNFTNASFASSTSMVNNSSGLGQHSIILTGLTPNTTYYFQVKSRDANNNLATDKQGTDGYSFTTMSGPAISAVSASEIKNESAVITWNTDTAGDSYAVYSSNANLSGSTQVGSASSSATHSVSLSGLTSGTKYYFYVKSGQTRDNNGGNYYFFTTTNDAQPPVISGVGAGSVSDTAAVIGWVTDKAATSKAEYGLASGSYTSSSTLDSSYNFDHSVSLSGLSNSTKYYYRVISADQNGNSATSSEYDFTTSEALSTETQVQAREGTARNSSTGGGMLIIDKTDKQAPLISGIKTSDIKSDSVIVSWITDEDADSFVEYGAGDLGGNFGKYEMVKNHSAVIKNLLSDKDYVFKVASRDASGNLSVSSQGSFSTLSLSEELDQGGSGDNMLKSALEKTIGIIKLVSSHVSIGTMENALEVSYNSIEDLASIVPAPFMSGEPRMEITPTTATISWFTDKDSNSLVAIAREGEYDPEKENSYLQVVGLPEDDTKFHAVTMYDLEPDTVYHYQLRNQPKVGPMSKSKDFVFKTNKEALEIVTHTIQKVSQKEAAFKWITNASTDSTVKYIPYRNNVLSIDEAKIKTDKTMADVHEITVDDFEPGTVYEVELSGRDIKDNMVIKTVNAFYTSEEDLPPTIYQIQTNTTISPGKELKVQTIISWLTDEPATSRVYFQKGVSSSSAQFAEKTVLDANYTKKHAVVITKFNPGSIYTFRVESIDSSGNVTLSKTFTILTPRQRETVFQVIMKNLEQVFGWMGNVKK